jgi:hypothetical protein
MADKIIRTTIPAAAGLIERPVLAWCIERYEEDDDPNERVIPITTDLTMEPRNRRDLLLRDPAGVYHHEEGAVYRSDAEALTYFINRASQRSARSAAP